MSKQEPLKAMMKRRGIKFGLRALQYRHDDESHIMLDARETQDDYPMLRNTYYVGYQIKTSEEIIYHHATILTEDLKSMFEGMAKIHNSLIARYKCVEQPKLVYLRSYLLLDDSPMIDTIRESMSSRLEYMAVIRKSDHYLSYCLAGDDDIVELESDTENAVNAIGRVLKVGSEQSVGKPLLLLGAWPSHPITAEYNEHFDYAEERILAMIEDPPAGHA